ncbi:4Fe-4S dicluster domain-containing protein [Celerinatantimonas sp. YJH-8]|uniref:electron transfer flavoprotein-ubiquinone oxidoreductase n=1 Tax=Celerinatantimonas sp. YJH-8 TaxID=3228714 RepID=UPI0038BFEAED
MTEADLTYDVIIVGAGPAGLAAAIRLKQRQPDCRVCVLEKGAAVGDHILSGALVSGSLASRIFPEHQWHTSPPATVTVTQQYWWWLRSQRAFSLPKGVVPRLLKPAHSNQILSLGDFCRWLAGEATALGVDLFTAQAVAKGWYGETGRLQGVITADIGRDGEGVPGLGFVPGIHIAAQYTLVAEGARGSLTRELEERLKLRTRPQHYALGVKERWVCDHPQWQPGMVIHTLGWPMLHGGGGGFIYAMSERELHLGIVTPLSDSREDFDPYAQFAQWRAHPEIAAMLKGARREGFGARVMAEGGWDAYETPVFPGGALLGSAAGLLDLRQLQGITPAIDSGMLAAEAVSHQLTFTSTTLPRSLLTEYATHLSQGAVGIAMRQAAPIYALLHHLGTRWGVLACGCHYWLRGLHLRLPYAQCHSGDHEVTGRIGPVVLSLEEMRPELNEQLFQARIQVLKGQPGHLRLADGGPAQDYMSNECMGVLQHSCPAGVYQWDGQALVIKHENCLHCKCCDIRDPLQQIHWTPPPAGGGPRYSQL